MNRWAWDSMAGNHLSLLSYWKFVSKYSFKVEVISICMFLLEVCKAIIEVYKDEVLRCPKTEEERKEVVEGFNSRWNELPQLFGGCGRQACCYEEATQSWIILLKYKGFHSIVLMAVIDARILSQR